MKSGGAPQSKKTTTTKTTGAIGMGSSNNYLQKGKKQKNQTKTTNKTGQNQNTNLNNTKNKNNSQNQQKLINKTPVKGNNLNGKNKNLKTGASGTVSSNNGLQKGQNQNTNLNNVNNNSSNINMKNTIPKETEEFIKNIRTFNQNYDAFKQILTKFYEIVNSNINADNSQKLQAIKDFFNNKRDKITFLHVDISNKLLAAEGIEKQLDEIKNLSPSEEDLKDLKKFSEIQNTTVFKIQKLVNSYQKYMEQKNNVNNINHQNNNENINNQNNNEDVVLNNFYEQTKEILKSFDEKGIMEVTDDIGTSEQLENNEQNNEQRKDKIMSFVLSLFSSNFADFCSLGKKEPMVNNKTQKSLEKLKESNNIQRQPEGQKSFWGKIGDWFKEKASSVWEWCQDKVNKMNLDTVFKTIQTAEKFVSNKFVLTAIAVSTGCFLGVPSYLLDLCSNGLGSLSEKILENIDLFSFLGEKGSTLSNIGTYLLKGISGLCGATSKVLSGGSTIFDSVGFIGTFGGLTAGILSLSTNYILSKFFSSKAKSLLKKPIIENVLDIWANLARKKELFNKKELNDKEKKDLIDVSNKIKSFSEKIDSNFLKENIFKTLDDTKKDENTEPDIMLYFNDLAKYIVENSDDIGREKGDLNNFLKKIKDNYGQFKKQIICIAGMTKAVLEYMADHLKQKANGQNENKVNEEQVDDVIIHNSVESGVNGKNNKISFINSNTMINSLGNNF